MLKNNNLYQEYDAWSNKYKNQSYLVAYSPSSEYNYRLYKNKE